MKPLWTNVLVESFHYMQSSKMRWDSAPSPSSQTVFNYLMLYTVRKDCSNVWMDALIGRSVGQRRGLLFYVGEHWALDLDSVREKSNVLKLEELMNIDERHWQKWIGWRLKIRAFGDCDYAWI